MKWMLVLVHLKVGLSIRCILCNRYFLSVNLNKIRVGRISIDRMRNYEYLSNQQTIEKKSKFTENKISKQPVQLTNIGH